MGNRKCCTVGLINKCVCLWLYIGGTQVTNSRYKCTCVITVNGDMMQTVHVWSQSMVQTDHGQWWHDANSTSVITVNSDMTQTDHGQWWHDANRSRSMVTWCKQWPPWAQDSILLSYSVHRGFEEMRNPLESFMCSQKAGRNADQWVLALLKLGFVLWIALCGKKFWHMKTLYRNTHHPWAPTQSVHGPVK